MFERLEVTRMAQAMAAHAGQRMGLIAGNVANADTPGYKAQDLPDFTATWRAERGEALRATRPGHLTAALPAMTPDIARAMATEPNGNSVSLEGEMVKAAEARAQHDMALSIYSAASDITRTALGRGR